GKAAVTGAGASILSGSSDLLFKRAQLRGDVG
ncbi:hypothetical protein LCGC14_1202830, partial [marine sediment metagenome]